MEKTIGKYKIEIIQDESPFSPREDDNLGTMVCFHNRYTLGDKHDYNSDNYRGWDEMKDAISETENVGVILPLYLYDHSGITISTTPFSCQWDSGQIGFIFISKEKIKEEYSTTRVHKKLVKQVTEYLENKVKEYDQYLRGEVYGFRITDTTNGEEIDSCWGVYGEECCMTVGESSLMNHIKYLEGLEVEGVM